MAVALLAAIVAVAAYLGINDGGYFPGATGVACAAVCAVGAVRSLVAPRLPVAFGWAAFGGLAGLALLAAWSLLSASWSDAPARAVFDFDRILLYLVVFGLVASVPTERLPLRWVLRAAAATLTGLVLVGLVSRLLPDLIHAPPIRGIAQLAHPFGYWNALGVACALACVLCLHFTVTPDEPAWLRVIAAACLPAIAVTGYLTLSRGALVATGAGLLVVLVGARPRTAITGLLASGPAAALAVYAAYGAEGLVELPLDAPATLDQGRELALVVAGACAAAAALRGLGLLLDRADPQRPTSARRRMAVAAAAVLAAGLTIAVVTDAPAELERFLDRVADPVVQTSADNRDRLFEVGSNGRVQQWRVQVDSISEHPWRGVGAGTFVHVWAQERPNLLRVQDGHSLYLETLTELGVVGLALLLIALATSIGALIARRARDRPAHIAALAFTVTWALHAAWDWDWEVPAVTIWLVAILGAGCAAAAARPGRPGLWPVRVAAAAALLFAAVLPVRVALSQRAVSESLAAFARGDCEATERNALSATRALSSRTEPFELRGYCAVRGGRAAEAVVLLRAAERRDPRSWELRYGLALTQAMAGGDPRPSLRRALAVNPREPLLITTLKQFDDAPAGRWPEIASAATLVLPDSP